MRANLVYLRNQTEQALYALWRDEQGLQTLKASTGPRERGGNWRLQVAEGLGTLATYFPEETRFHSTIHDPALDTLLEQTQRYGEQVHPVTAAQKIHENVDRWRRKGHIYRLIDLEAFPVVIAHGSRSIEINGDTRQNDIILMQNKLLGQPLILAERTIPVHYFDSVSQEQLLMRAATNYARAVRNWRGALPPLSVTASEHHTLPLKRFIGNGYTTQTYTTMPLDEADVDSFARRAAGEAVMSHHNP